MTRADDVIVVIGDRAEWAAATHPSPNPTDRAHHEQITASR
jgi:hypothetical protein